LWQAIEWRAAAARPPPFWAFAWPGSRALARYLLDHPEAVAGRAVLDCGAGSGLVAIAAAAAGSTTVTFATPKAGSTISLHSNPYTAVAGGVSFAASNSQTTRFYLRRDGCGTSNDNPRLSTTGGTDAGDGCGTARP